MTGESASATCYWESNNCRHTPGESQQSLPLYGCRSYELPLWRPAPVTELQLPFEPHGDCKMTTTPVLAHVARAQHGLRGCTSRPSSAVKVNLLLVLLLLLPFAQSPGTRARAMASVEGAESERRPYKPTWDIHRSCRHSGILLHPKPAHMPLACPSGSVSRQLSFGVGPHDIRSYQLKVGHEDVHLQQVDSSRAIEKPLQACP